MCLFLGHTVDRGLRITERGGVTVLDGRIIAEVETDPLCPIGEDMLEIE